MGLGEQHGCRGPQNSRSNCRIGTGPTKSPPPASLPTSTPCLQIPCAKSNVPSVRRARRRVGRTPLPPRLQVGARRAPSRHCMLTCAAALQPPSTIMYATHPRSRHAASGNRRLGSRGYGSGPTPGHPGPLDISAGDICSITPLRSAVALTVRDKGRDGDR